MVVSRICNSLLHWYSPRDAMLCYFSSIDSIWWIVKIILIYHDNTFWFPRTGKVDLEENGYVLSTRKCKWIVWLSIKTCYHHPLVLREYFCIRSICEIDQWFPWFPLLRRSISPIRNCFRECDTLSDIPCFWKLWEKLISWISHRARIRRVCHQSEILGIDWLSDHSRIHRHEDLPSWHYPFLPISFRDTTVIPWERECSWRLYECHKKFS